MTQADDALKPCPFCGGEAEHSVGKTGDGKPWHYVECVECGASGPNSPYADHNIAVVQFRAEAWNTRVDLATPPDPLADPRVSELLEAWLELSGHCSIEEGVCCCGEDMENHSNPMNCGHSPVDHGAYVASHLVERTLAELKGGKHE
jgi:Lar family restriction alleviation protein